MRPLIDIRGLCPLLQVFDMPLSVRFYCELLGFEISSRSPTYAAENGVELFHWALLRRGETELMLNTAYDEGERPAFPAPERVASHADTALFFGCPDVDYAYEQVKSHGVACAPPKTARYGMRQLSFRDPDGYEITGLANRRFLL
jgi:catechol 2,3-dioxygenase-like lactoylglutathione lyase family enzyme